MYSALLYNINVATSITSQGRALTSSMTMLWEMFLANNVQFGSLNEVMQFIDNIVQERKERKYIDYEILDENVRVEDCFAKVILTCGYRWVPTESEMEIIWKTINNLSQEDINRIYYKNNLYEFISNKKVFNIIKTILKKLKSPLFNSLDIPEEISKELKLLSDLMMEYVYYRYMIIDRIDRCDNMIKSTIMVSDTDSCIVSLDAWYRFALDVIKDEDLQIRRFDPVNVLSFVEKDEFGDTIDLRKLQPFEFEEPEEHYDFINDEIIFKQHAEKPFIIMPQDYVRYSLMNIMAYVVDDLINKYMEQFTKNNHSWTADKKCKIILKNEFLG